MKRIIAVFVGGVATLSLLFAGVLSAANVRSGQAPTIMKDEVINGTLYATGETLKVEGRVQGDLICAGQTVVVTGVVEGDVLCAAQDITVSGHVEGSVRVLAQIATLNGQVDGSASAVAMTATIGADAVIARDLTLAAQQANLDGTVTRDATVTGTTFTTTARVGRDLDVTAEAVTLAAKTDVAGDFRYVSETTASVADGARVAGKTDHRVPETPEQTSPTLAGYVSSLIFGVFSFALIGVLMMLAVPRQSNTVAATMVRSPLATFGVGLITALVAPLLSLFLLVSTVGIPLGVVLLLGAIMMYLLGIPFAGLALSQIIIKKAGWQTTSPWRHTFALLGSLAVIFLLSMVPYVGGWVVVAAIVWGVGGLAYSFGAQRKMQAAKKPEA